MADVRQVRVLRHSAWAKKDKQGNPMQRENSQGEKVPVFDYQAEIAFAMGQPSVTVYLKEEEAAALKGATGNGFGYGEAFTPYDATATFEPVATIPPATKVGERVRPRLGCRCIGLEAAEGGSRRRAA
ncbi:MAG: hypothetical protein AAF368_18075 [Planctomycetota bacterium]